MIAVDTNVLVRLLTGDDPVQAAAARSLFASGPIWIAKTVLLETVWVLRRLYGFEVDTIQAALRRLLGLKNVHAEDESAVAAALELTARGMEFADALHVHSRPRGAVFAIRTKRSASKLFSNQCGERRDGVPKGGEKGVVGGSFLPESTRQTGDDPL
ncbi:MAG: type II toxin-antitoxin system VapC family toxin [Candidatus Solibacter usitatus]|nr:type II toxin-antitoxin system VapC family toxin [Candidatus Solibacter usitatus]